jgi:hypothetical protein
MRVAEPEARAAPSIRPPTLEIRSSRLEARPVSRYVCLVADDHPATLGAVYDYVPAEEIEDCAAKITTIKPTVAIVDLRTPKLSGTETIDVVAVPIT